MYWSRLPADTISDYVFARQFIENLHPKLRTEMDTYYTPEDSSLAELFKAAERYDAVYHANGTYGSECKPEYKEKNTKSYAKAKQAKGKQSTEKQDSHTNERRCFTCDGKGHMAKNCPSKKPDRKTNIKKETSSNRAEQVSETEEIYINAMEIESYAAAGATRPAAVKANEALEGTVYINGKEARVLFDTGTIGANLISAAFVTTHGIPCKEMEKPTKIHMAMKGSRSESQKDCVVSITAGSFQTKDTKMLVGNLAKYDALIGMPSLRKHKVSIECGTLCIYFPEHKVRINCTPTSGYVRAAVASTSDIMDQHPEVFPETIPEVLPPLRKINHKIRFKPGAEQKTHPTYAIPEQYVGQLNELIRDKERKGMIK